MKDKKGRQGKLPFRKEIELPKPKHVQVQRGLAIKLLNTGFTETDRINGEDYPYLYKIAEHMSNLNYSAETFIRQMVASGYLVIRTKAPDQESYYICRTKEQGRALNKILKKKKAA